MNADIFTDDWKWIATNLRKGRENMALLLCGLRDLGVKKWI